LPTRSEFRFSHFCLSLRLKWLHRLHDVGQCNRKRKLAQLSPGNGGDEGSF
jgi:hypothetical protein